MRSKAVLSIIAFLAAFGISVALTPRQSKPGFAPYASRGGCAKTETARRITNLLERDIQYGVVLDRKMSQLRQNGYSRDSETYYVNFARLTNEYVTASESIDDSDLPSDFKAAWREHMKAWRVQADFLNETSYDAPRKRSYGIGSGPGKSYSEQNNEINNTWFETLRIARKYDAYIPPGAY
ncbi:MAG TPA: hypothetical protein VF599_10355 [Pyrinomonadaceae bacterium]|jgi:hypothetical protein